MNETENRTFIAICNLTNFDGYYLRKFTLPKILPEDVKDVRVFAKWYFLNVLNFTACIEHVILTEAEYNNVIVQEQIHENYY
jgi:hypothetical protein